MSKKQAIFKTRGMNRDLSVSAFNPEFSFENINLRLSTNEGNTTMSWVNEKGTSLITFLSSGKWNDDDTSDTTFVTSIAGMPIGTAVINHQLVLFTHVVPDDNSANEQESNPIDSDDSDASNSDNLDDSSSVPMLSDTPTSPQEGVVVSTPSEGKDHIYVIKYTDNNKREVKCKELFSGNLHFSEKHPLETLTSYESSDIQKVYWVDGINQPRMINLSTPESHYYNGDTTPINSSFDFIEELALSEDISVTKGFSTGGEFPSGVIQYAFTYYNKYGQESNIFHVTPLYYISHSDRGGAPDEKIGNVFNISVSNLDSKFDYLRIYSIIRTSLNATPIVRRVHDIKINRTEGQAPTEDIPDYLPEGSYKIIAGKNWLNLYTTNIRESFTFWDATTSSFKSIDEFLDTYAFEESSEINNVRISLPNIGERFPDDTDNTPKSIDFDSDWESGEEEESESVVEGSNGGNEIYHDITTDDCEFTVVGGEAILGEYKCISFENIKIPSSVTIGGTLYPVTQIDSYAFCLHKELKYVKIPKGVYYVGDNAFKGCSNLLSVEWTDEETSQPSPSEVEHDYRLCANAFKDCERLLTISLHRLDTLDSGVFWNCKNLASFTIPDDFTIINSDTFRNCSGLSSIIIPDSVNEIGAGAFEGCTGLKELNLNNVVTVGSRAFADCTGLNKVTVDSDTSSEGINLTAFSGCTDITTLVFNCSTVRNWFADSKNSLRILVLGNIVTNVTSGVFTDCINLSSITVGSGLSSIKGMFHDSSIVYLSLDCTNVGNANDNWFVSNNSNTLTNLETLIFGDNVETLAAETFDGCSNLTSVTFGTGITSIGDNAFRGCNNLVYIKMALDDPSGITIDNEPFNFTSDKEKEDVTLYIPAEARTNYENDTYWKYFTIIDRDAIKIGDFYYTLSNNPNTAIVVSSTNVDRYEGNLEIPSSITYNSTSYSVTGIDTGAFASCVNLTSIVIPSTINYTTSGSVKTPSIPFGAFEDCSKLKKVTFKGIDLVTLDWEQNEAIKDIFGNQVEEYVVESKVENVGTTNPLSIGKYAFSNCEAEVITLPNNIEYIDNYAFFKCDYLKHIVIGDNVTGIGEYAFARCTSAEDIILGKNVSVIKSRAFHGCAGLVSVEATMEDSIPHVYDNPSDIEDSGLYVIKNAFSNISTVTSTGCTLYVPRDKYQVYEEKGWFGMFSVSYPQRDPRFQEGSFYYYRFNIDTFPNLVFKSENRYYTWSNASLNAYLNNNNTTTTIYLFPGWTRFTNGLIGPALFCEQNNGTNWELTNLGIYDKTEAPSYTDTSVYTFTDTNTIGELVDPTHLLYLGGNAISAKTIEQKDNTLFLGNINLLREPISDKIKDDILTNSGSSSDSPLITNNISCVLQERFYILPVKKESDGTGNNIASMGYMSTLTSTDADNYQGASAFKNGEYYRLGLQFQHKTGKWSEPVWIGDTQCSVTNLYSDETNGYISVPEFRYTLGSSICGKIYNADYRKVRAVYVQPQEQDRIILCQGVACPTMYRKCDRKTGKLHAQSSWLYRVKFNTNLYEGYKDNFGIVGAVEYQNVLPSMWNYEDGAKQSTSVSNQAATNEQSDQGGLVAQDQTRSGSTGQNDSSANSTVYTSNITENEGNIDTGVWMPYYRSTEITGAYNEDDIYRIDNSFITINSPDVEFDFTRNYSDLKDTALYKVGCAELTYTFGDIDIQTSSPTIGDNCRGFIHKPVVTHGTSALISGNYYEDCVVWDWYLNNNEANPKHEIVYKQLKWDEGGGDYDDVTPALPALWPVCMWQKKGSLNNDVNREGRSSVLLKKIISNYRNAASSDFNSSAVKLNSSDIKLWNNTEAAQIIKVDGKVYQGCVDTMVTPSVPSAFYLTGLPLRRKTGDDKNVFAWYPEFSDVPVVKLFKPAPPKKDNKKVEAEGGYSMLIYNGSSGNHYEEDGTDHYLYPGDISSRGLIDIVNYHNNAWTYMQQQWSTLGTHSFGLVQNRESVPIKYKSSPHLVASLTSNIDLANVETGGDIPIVEVRKDYKKDVLFGGTSDEAFQAATWIPCGPAVPISKESDTKVPFKWGDTYYQRYECLKTYAYTPDDINQVVEIGSFMLETRVNIDGRYDRNRCQTSNLYASPQNFNLINPVYSQQDNFFNYKIYPKEYYKNRTFPNQITWSLTKESGSDIDVWTNITMANTLEMDGSLGSVNKLTRFNNQLISLQDKGIARIMYNESMQISSTEGVPIELANSGKVQGKRYISNTIGCSNKWSIVTTPNGIYFIDSLDKNIYILNEGLGNISNKFGFNSWCKQQIPHTVNSLSEWNPADYEDFVSYYDKKNQDVLFINKNTALAFSEKLEAFTSFYDYGNTPYLCNFEDTGVWIDKESKLWKHQGGEYCKFFGNNKPYSITFVGNPEPLIDKIFTNLEFRACVEGEGTVSDNVYSPYIPFDFLETWDEYQHGIATLSAKQKPGSMQHHLLDKSASLNRRYRIWACDIPRDNVPTSEQSEPCNYTLDTELGITRFNSKPMDRMRNPWIYLKLKKKQAEIGENSLPKTEIHDLVMTYYI